MVPVNPADEGALPVTAGELSYGGYLGLSQLLSAQHPQSRTHDELLFIIQHQTSELWMKLVVHELTAARLALRARDMAPAFKMLARIARIFEQLNGAWDVLRTMTPSEYTAFRDFLGPSSGFQSLQYRQIEFMLGNRNPHMLKVHQADAEAHAVLTAEIAQPSLYHEVINILVSAFAERLEIEFDKNRPHQANPQIMALWQRVYEDVESYWTLYELAEKLVDLEDYFRRWRFNHVTTVERVIGFKRGTGGTAGVAYLRKMLAVELFPELWRVRTEL